MEADQPKLCGDTPASLDSLEDKEYTSKASVKVNEYYKQIDLIGISSRDVKKIRSVARKTSILQGIFKEVSLAIATSSIGALLGKIISGMNWQTAIDVVYFFVCLLIFVVFFSIYVFFCYKKYLSHYNLIQTLDEHLFIPTGVEAIKK